MRKNKFSIISFFFAQLLLGFTKCKIFFWQFKKYASDRILLLTNQQKMLICCDYCLLTVRIIVNIIFGSNLGNYDTN